MTATLAQRTAELQRGVSARRRELGALSPEYFAELYLPAHFGLPPSRMHRELFTMLGAAATERGARIAVAAPRGHAKSTVASLAYVLWAVLYGHDRFVLLISATREQAVQLLKNIKDEIQTNPRLLADFPEACQAPGARQTPKPWRDNNITLRNGAMIRALGSGQGVRGTKHRQDRPSLVVVDDLEEQDQCLSAEQRQKTREWFEKTLLKVGDHRTNYIVVGTILHYDSLLASLTHERLMRGKGVGWARRVYRAVEAHADRGDLWEKWEAIRFGEAEHERESGPKAATRFLAVNTDDMLVGSRVLWPEREDYPALMAMRADEGRISFQSEKQNEPLDPAECIFRDEIIRYWDDDHAGVPELLKAIGSGVKFYGACDPSLGQRANRGDYTAIITIARDVNRKISYVVDADLARRTPDQTIERLIALAGAYRYTYFLFESNQFQVVMADQLRERSRLAGQTLHVTEVKNTANKRARIQSLEPMIATGQLRFSRRQTLLLDQLRQFPLGAHDDGPDALEMAAVKASKSLNRPVCRSVF